MQTRFYSGSIVVTYIHSVDSSSVEAIGIHHWSSFNRRRPTTFYNSILLFQTILTLKTLERSSQKIAVAFLSIFTLKSCVY